MYLIYSRKHHKACKEVKPAYVRTWGLKRERALIQRELSSRRLWYFHRSFSKFSYHYHVLQPQLNYIMLG